MTFADNTEGVSLAVSGDSASNKIRVKNLKIYGESATINLDCPKGQGCWCTKKTGMMLFTNNKGSKDLHPTMPSALPIYKIKSGGGWGADIELDGVQFINWPIFTLCGKFQEAIMRNSFASDYIPMHIFKNTLFKNVHQDAVMHITDPDPKWANPTDCGNVPCTAPNNIVLKFRET